MYSTPTFFFTADKHSGQSVQILIVADYYLLGINSMVYGSMPLAIPEKSFPVAEANASISLIASSGKRSNQECRIFDISIFYATLTASDKIRSRSLLI